MSSIAAAGYPARRGRDRGAFLVFVALVWAGVLSGFGFDTYGHLHKYGLDYPLIVHFHAVTFVSWLVLFTVQVLLIRNDRPDLHRQLGASMALLAAVMVVLGPATALIVDARDYTLFHITPEFLAVQFTDMIAFAALTGSGLLLRRASPAHKRLMLLGLIYISDAGFARLLNPLIAAPFGHGLAASFAQLYLGSDLLLLGLGAWDLATRRTLHPAYLAGAALTFTLQATAIFLLFNPAWKAFSLHLIGH